MKNAIDNSITRCRLRIDKIYNGREIVDIKSPDLDVLVALTEFLNELYDEKSKLINKR